MSFEKILEELNIDKIGHYEGDDYIVNLRSSDDISRLFYELDVSGAEQLDERTLVTETLTALFYKFEDCYITLSANYDTDKYKLILSTKKPEEEEV